MSEKNKQKHHDQIRTAGSLNIPPSELADAIGLSVKEVADGIFTEGSEFNRVYREGAAQFKLHYESYIMKTVLGMNGDTKIDKTAVAALDAIRATNKKQLDKERRAWENNE